MYRNIAGVHLLLGFGVWPRMSLLSSELNFTGNGHFNFVSLNETSSHFWICRKHLNKNCTRRFRDIMNSLQILSAVDHTGVR